LASLNLLSSRPDSQTAPREVASGEGAPTRAFDAPTLDEAMARVRAELGPDAEVVEASRVRRGGVGGFFAREWVEIVARPATTSPAATPSAPAPPPVPPALPTEPASSVLDIVERVNEIERSAAAETTIDLTEPSTERETFGDVLRRIVEQAQTEAAAPTAPPAAAPAAAPPTAAPTAAPAVRETEVRETEVRETEVRETGGGIGPALLRLGVPAEFVPWIAPGEDVAVPLALSFAHLPEVPTLPATRGVVIAVVGRASAAVGVAQQLVADLGLTRESLIVATPTPLSVMPTWLQVTDAAAAIERRRSWRRRETPTVVVVPCARSGGIDFARSILDALEPTMVWGIVDAGRKPEDVTAWGERLGGIDALAIEDVAGTVSPAAVLGTGIPVGCIDAEPATARRWAAIVTERLAADGLVIDGRMRDGIGR
jgi:hypothetical protein